jgi:Fe-S cluster assembly ATP-binding protein
MPLEISQLHVAVQGKQIVKGVSLDLAAGSIHALMGPNGSGKSTLAYALAGHPSFAVVKGKILLNGKDISRISPEARARAGLFLSFQHPVEVAGITVQQFLRSAICEIRQEIPATFETQLVEACKQLQIPEALLGRSLNEGFSGGEKKRVEMLQLLMLKPAYAILDEVDSGLDVDAIKLVASVVSKLQQAGSGILVITHSSRLLKFLAYDRVYIMQHGVIVDSGKKDLVQRIEASGFQQATP